MEVGDRLRAAREQRGLTIGDLAAKMGVNVTTVTLWENRKNRRQIGPKHVQRAAEVLGIRVSELLGEVEQPEPRPGIMTTDLAEEQLLRLFRLMPEKVQLFQLAQFVETVAVSESGYTRSHDQRQDRMPSGSPENDQAR
jgi:transcriptional regulator with XRE-family HTH domain